jgi:putative tricarboxylic transport membrane protein
MQTISNIFGGFVSIMEPWSLLIMLLGVVTGIIFGSIPGLSAAMAVALFLPVTFSMDPTLGMSLLVSLYIGGISGGLIAAILLNIPGTPSSIATCFDGAPMARKGEAGKALGLGIVFSFLGGLFSFIILMFIAPPLAKVALRFSSIEYFAVTVFALSMIATVSAGNFIVGILSGMLGLMLSSIGLAPIDATPRFTFGMEDLAGGFDILPSLIGIFAITEVLNCAESIKALKDIKPIELKPIKGFGFSMAEFAAQKWNFFRSSIIGAGIGILPGIGGSTSGILAYIAAKRSSKTPEKFGAGISDGVVASETANNATIGGALVPLLALGIPGDGVTAILLGGFMIHGLTPGPLLFVNNSDLVYAILATCIVANVMMLAIEFFGIRVFVHMLSVPKHYLMPILLVVCMVGAYAVNNRMFDAKSILYFGILGYAMAKLKMPVAPFILSFILGGMVETNLRRGLMLTEGSFLAFFAKPISGCILAATVLVLVWCVYKEWRGSRPNLGE